MKIKYNPYIDNFDLVGEGDQYVGAQIKQYSEAAGDFTVTGLGNPWTTISAVAIPYQTINGIWKLRFNFVGQVPSLTPISYYSMTISGIVSKNLTNCYQSIACAEHRTQARGAEEYFVGYLNPNSNQITLVAPKAIDWGVDTNYISVSGDVELESKPTWAEEFPAINLTTSALAVRDSYRNLAASRPSVTTVNVTADELILQNSSGLVYRASGVNVTADITASGANGLDTGSEANSTWYHIWVIYNGTTKAGLLSTSATSPTMPSGYTYKAYAGAVYNDSGGDFDSFDRQGNSVTIDLTIIGTSLNDTSYTARNLGSLVPITAKRIKGSIQIYALADYTQGVRMASTSSGKGEKVFAIQAAVAPTSGNSVSAYHYFKCELLETQTIYSKQDNNANTRQHSLYLHSYEF